MDSVLVAHVADSIERVSGGAVQDYDATADFAANLLEKYPHVETAAAKYADGRMDAGRFDTIVEAAAAKFGE